MTKSPLLDQVRSAIRVRHYIYRTEQTYIQWIKRFILFHNKRRPTVMGEREVAALNEIVSAWARKTCATLPRQRAHPDQESKSSIGLELLFVEELVRRGLMGEIRVPALVLGDIGVVIEAAVVVAPGRGFVGAFIQGADQVVVAEQGQLEI
jgi:hypothetical protein